MRLSQQQQHTITSTIAQFDASARVYLFGSRANDNARGGDIDLAVISSQLNFSDKLRILAQLHQQLGEQKIDLLIDADGSSEFIASVLPQAIALNPTDFPPAGNPSASPASNSPADNSSNPADKTS